MIAMIMEPAIKERKTPMKILRKYEKEIAELYHINNLMFIIGTNNDFVPQDVGESVYYLSDRMKKALDSLCFSSDEDGKQLL